ncbi:MAG: ribosome maturation factor RimP [Halanaerobiaceae bacterium]
MGKTTDIVTGIAEPIVENQGLNLVDVEYVKEGPGYYLRVFIDNEENNIGLDQCEKVSILLSKELDRIDPIEESYILEVSSPGIERSLKTRADFDNFQGSLVTVKTYAPIDGKKEFTGNLIQREDDNIKIKLKDQNKMITIPFDSIAAANIAVDF